MQQLYFVTKVVKLGSVTAFFVWCCLKRVFTDCFITYLKPTWSFSQICNVFYVLYYNVPSINAPSPDTYTRSLKSLSLILQATKHTLRLHCYCFHKTLATHYYLATTRDPINENKSGSVV